MRENDPIFIAGARGLVGSAITRRLAAEGFRNLLTPSRAEVDLGDRAQVDAFFARTRPAYVFLAAAKVGGIHANATWPADFLTENLRIQLNVIDAAHRFEVTKLLFLGSSCIYPKLCPQPIREEYLLTGALEPTNQAYAIAKIAGLEMVQAYRRQHRFRAIAAMPTNLYGPGDNYHPENSHVLPALIRRFHLARRDQAPEVVVWGTGTPRREFLHVDDLASACLFLMRHYEDATALNVGVGEDVAIADLARLVADTVGYRGAITFDSARPDGTPRKLLDVSRLSALGWRAGIGLAEGLAATYRAFLADHPDLAGRAAHAA
jgi:GDP-L-fucose synthase